MLPRLQGENWDSVSEAVGLMMNREEALHEVVLKGQQALDVVQPSVHFRRYNQRWNPWAEGIGKPTSCWVHVCQQPIDHR